MIDLVRRRGHLPEEHAILTENFLVTREFRAIATADQRRDLLDCLFAVSAVDESISSAEEAQVRQIASELGFEHPEYIQPEWRMPTSAPFFALP